MRGGSSLRIYIRCIAFGSGAVLAALVVWVSLLTSDVGIDPGYLLFNVSHSATAWVAAALFFGVGFAWRLRKERFLAELSRVSTTT